MTVFDDIEYLMNIYKNIAPIGITIYPIGGWELWWGEKDELEESKS